MSEMIILSASDSNNYILYVFRIEYFQLYNTSNDSKGLKDFFRANKILCAAIDIKAMQSHFFNLKFAISHTQY